MFMRYKCTAIYCFLTASSGLSSTRRKLIGMVKYTLTGWPFCLPGFHLGIPFTTLSASSSHPAPMPFKTVQSDIWPSSFTTNFMITLPVILLCLAESGYLMLFARYSFMSYSALGISSTRVYEVLSFFVVPEFWADAESARHRLRESNEYFMEQKYTYPAIYNHAG